MPAIAKHHRTNFNTMLQAAKTGRLALLDCADATTDKQVVAIITVSDTDDGEYQFTPFAIMIDGNPFELLVPPDPSTP